MPIAEFSNWLRRVIWGRILRGRHHGTRLNSVDYPSINCLFSVFSNINGEHESTLTTSKKYSWCIPVQKEIKPIIWGAAITPEPWNRQQCWFIFEDPNARVARLSESLATITAACGPWWRHQMETFSALLALCEGKPPVTGGFLSQRPVTHSFDVFFDLRLNKWLSKQWRDQLFETPSPSLWCHCNVKQTIYH